MAALVYLLCDAIQQLNDLTTTLIKTNFDVKKTVSCLRNRRNFRNFYNNCHKLWISEELSRYEWLSPENRYRIAPHLAVNTWWINKNLYNKIINEKVNSKISNIFMLIRMQRSGIDYAAIEATAEAYEAFEYLSESGDNTKHNQFNLEELTDIEEIAGQEVDVSFYEYVDRLPVYRNNNLGKMVEGVSFTVTGYILQNCERFSINFVIENITNDVALHINPRLPQGYIVRNTCTRGSWGLEEVSSALPFSLHRGTTFSIQVLLTHLSYLISINGVHFASYYHRLPYESVTTLEVKGDVENVKMHRKKVDSYPERLPHNEVKNIEINLKDKATSTDIDEIDRMHIPKEWRIVKLWHLKRDSLMIDNKMSGLDMPFYGVFNSNTLVKGRYVRIVGRIKLLPHSFYINLQKGQQIWPHPLIALHLNPRFSKQSGAIGKSIICRNAWYAGRWAQEERSEIKTDFRPGKTFTLAIVCCENQFEVYLDRKLMLTFDYHQKPEIVDTIYIQGDIKLWNVTVEDNF